jgi:hypothetical protein
MVEKYDLLRDADNGKGGSGFGFGLSSTVVTTTVGTSAATSVGTSSSSSTAMSRAVLASEGCILYYGNINVNLILTHLKKLTKTRFIQSIGIHARI